MYAAIRNVARNGREKRERDGENRIHVRHRKEVGIFRGDVCGDKEPARMAACFYIRVSERGKSDEIGLN